MIVNSRNLYTAISSLAITGLISASVSTKSPMTIAPSPIGSKATSRQCKRRFDRHSIENHVEIAPRQAVAMNTARHGRAGLTESGVPTRFQSTSSALAIAAGIMTPRLPTVNESDKAFLSPASDAFSLRLGHPPPAVNH